MTHYGLIAFGRSGNWELSIDELIGESAQWFLQIESSIHSFQCGVPDLNAVRDLERLLAAEDRVDQNEGKPVQLGDFYGHPVVMTLDTEFSDRCFLTIGSSAEGRIAVTVAGQDLIDFQSALSQVVSELEQA